jgi:hypothetical protein
MVDSVGTESRRFPGNFETAQKCHHFLFEPLKAIAKDHGYCLMAQGSLARDLDYFAMPWIARPWSPAEMLEAMVAWMKSDNCPFLPYTRDDREFTRKWHGRLCYVIHVGGTYIDLQIAEPLPYGIDQV